MDLKTNDTSEELDQLTKRLIYEKQSKISIFEELLRIYESEEKLLLSYKQLSAQHYAISNAKLAKVTYAYWRLLKRIKRGKKNENS
ncbi:hypothetical protein MKZ08_12485 [Viridibacillus sp. FSL R5-0477]|uniref:Uncharacterized protein n=1 Tax=Viridibacillus arenosi FSL R5-213 TaxID=1227360 RepID=W4F143_9BACL|nr:MULTISPECIES: hypothetical protein [Viridibacillus]ETT86189.1 hypothetical protein C176_05742 [Viridibacillus arenosi FSL R5-213]OMC84905.1 hypothetical protein BK130_04650 [Viridibacillus sp. FSL H8-0123]OMC85751.1 hypothetical protein BK128_14085 [Viridibacillus sp. FSL H7-0596]OMC91954.1 hypothetical protein BK137_08590 [Viridibacillus arenosi]